MSAHRRSKLLQPGAGDRAREHLHTTLASSFSPYTLRVWLTGLLQLIGSTAASARSSLGRPVARRPGARWSITWLWHCDVDGTCAKICARGVCACLCLSCESEFAYETPAASSQHDIHILNSPVRVRYTGICSRDYASLACVHEHTQSSHTLTFSHSYSA